MFLDHARRDGRPHQPHVIVNGREWSRERAALVPAGDVLRDLPPDGAARVLVCGGRGRVEPPLESPCRALRQPHFRHQVREGEDVQQAVVAQQIKAQGVMR